MLEIANGELLHERLRHGAEHWAEHELSREPLCNSLYLTACGRPPTPTEMEVLRDLLPEQLDEEAIADLLWILVAAPDFQLVF